MSGHADLRQHFHNYFELLLGAERNKLQQAIVNVSAPSDRKDVLIEIECRINFLQGAVRMGKLLCLIDQEEAKTSFGMLAAERERLRETALHDGLNSQITKASPSGANRLASIRRALQQAN